MATFRFYIPKFSKAVTDLENARPATLAEVRDKAGARSVLRGEIKNIRYELGIYERELDRLEQKSPSAANAEALI